jgi:hypothetical protein
MAAARPDDGYASGVSAFFRVAVRRFGAAVSGAG